MADVTRQQEAHPTLTATDVIANIIGRFVSSRAKNPGENTLFMTEGRKAEREGGQRIRRGDRIGLGEDAVLETGIHDRKCDDDERHRRRHGEEERKFERAVLCKYCTRLVIGAQSA